MQNKFFILNNNVKLFTNNMSKISKLSLILGLSSGIFFNLANANTKEMKEEKMKHKKEMNKEEMKHKKEMKEEKMSNKKENDKMKKKNADKKQKHKKEMKKNEKAY